MLQGNFFLCFEKVILSLLTLILYMYNLTNLFHLLQL